MTPRKFLSGIDLASQKIVHVADGSVADDAATYGQVLALVNGKDYKDGVRAASTANVTISGPGTTLDGVTLAVNDRVLLKNQSTPSQNGIWVFNGAASALTRPLDFPTGTTATVTQGATVVAAEGTANAGTQWTLTTSGTINVDTTSLAFTETTSPGTTYSAGNGLSLTSTTFAVVPADSSLTVSGSGVEVNAGSGLETTTDIHVKAGTGITVDGSGVSVTSPKLKYSADIGDGSSTAITVTHSLGTRDVIVCIYDNSTHAEIDTDVVHTSTSVVTVNFAVAPSSNAYRIVVLG